MKKEQSAAQNKSQLLPTIARVERAIREAQAFVLETRHADPYNSQVGAQPDPWSRRDGRL